MVAVWVDFETSEGARFLSRTWSASRTPLKKPRLSHLYVDWRGEGAEGVNLR